MLTPFITPAAGATMGAVGGGLLGQAADALSYPRRLLWGGVGSLLGMPGEATQSGHSLLSYLGADPNNPLTTVGGLGLEIAGDPLTYAGGLLGRLAGVLPQAGMLSRAGSLAHEVQGAEGALEGWNAAKAAAEAQQLAKFRGFADTIDPDLLGLGQMGKGVTAKNIAHPDPAIADALVNAGLASWNHGVPTATARLPEAQAAAQAAYHAGGSAGLASGQTLDDMARAVSQLNKPTLDVRGGFFPDWGNPKGLMGTVQRQHLEMGPGGPAMIPQRIPDPKGTMAPWMTTQRGAGPSLILQQDATIPPLPTPKEVNLLRRAAVRRLQEAGAGSATPDTLAQWVAQQRAGLGGQPIAAGAFEDVARQQLPGLLPPEPLFAGQPVTQALGGLQERSDILLQELLRRQQMGQAMQPYLGAAGLGALGGTAYGIGNHLFNQ